MDLLQTVRKEGSRGGRANFKWEDVKTDQHRENYLGHSLMAPVGRWQKNKDLSWYSRSSDDKKSEEDARKEELKRIKEAESDALARALGYDVPPRPVEGANATPLNNGEDRMKKESGSEEPATVFQASNGQKLKESKPHRRSSEKRREERPRSRDRRHRRKRDREHVRRRKEEPRGEYEDGLRSRSRSRSPRRRDDRRRSESRERGEDDRRHVRRDARTEQYYHDDKLRRRSRSPSWSRDRARRNYSR